MCGELIRSPVPLVVLVLMKRMEHRATESEREALGEAVMLKDMGAPKGIGVVARRDLGEGKFVGVMAGRILAEETHDSWVLSGMVTGRYAMETRDRNYRPYVVEPEAPRQGKPSRRFKSSMGQYMNEPSGEEHVNVAWAFNPTYDPQRVECYTMRPVEAGRELLVHYGNTYSRTYERPCESPPPEYVPAGWEVST